MAFVGLGVSGGIGAYKAVEVVRLLQKHGHRVQVVMTRTARRFVGPLTFEAITREPVITTQFAPGLNAGIEHIALASEMDLLLVAPATANIIGKFANGIADDFLSALYLATKAPVLIAPAMNTHMWEHPALRRNLATLQGDGARFVEPGEGYLACGWVGAGRLAEPAAIVDTAHALLTGSSSLTGRRILVTAGPTIEDIDAVRYIGNRSSGRMGFALAAEAARRGAQVVLVTGPTELAPPPRVADVIAVRGAREMHAMVMSRLDRLDAVIMAAAVADYTPAGGPAGGKIEKGGPLTLDLERTTDILAELGRRRGESGVPVLVGFAAQAGPAEDAAARKLREKHVDLIVANDVTAPGAGFDVETNRVSLVSQDSVVPLPLMTKAEVAAQVLDRIERLLAVPKIRTGHHMSHTRDLIPHLHVYADLGVNGISRDPAWRERTEVGSDPALQGSDPTSIDPTLTSPPPDGVRPLETGVRPHQAPDQAAGLIALREDIGDCTRCALHTLGRRQIVFGAGNPSAGLMFVGEAPGADEDVQGVPFVGRAGQLLTKIIASIGLTRDEVYIANVIKCRPPGNRNPEPVEVATCSPFLQRQIDTIRPKVIVALGTFAAQALLQTKTPISRLRGHVHEFRDGIKVIPTFHPSFLLRNQQNRPMYRDVWEDMKRARAILDAPN